MKWTMRRAHKWIAVSVSALLFVWAATGVVMVAPWPTGQVRPSVARPLADWTGAAITPADAVRRAAGSAESARAVRTVELRWVGPRLVYDVRVIPGGVRLVDAVTGDFVTVTEELARAAAERQYPGPARAARVERMERPASDYLAGPLPAYRVTFADDEGTVAFVGATDGTVRWANRWGQIRRAITSLHDFYALRVFISDDGVRRWLVGITGTISVIAVLTGLYLALPARWRPRMPWKRSTDAPESA